MAAWHHSGKVNQIGSNYNHVQAGLWRPTCVFHNCNSLSSSVKSAALNDRPHYVRAFTNQSMCETHSAICAFSRLKMHAQLNGMLLSTAIYSVAATSGSLFTL